MSNMSYCMFENTNNDLGDCIDRMQECETLEELDLSKYEYNSFHNMARAAQEFLGEYRRLIETETDE